LTTGIQKATEILNENAGLEKEAFTALLAAV
jgi:hypothetical protein